MAEALETVAGRRGWIISDGKTGNDVQTRGVFDALRLEYTVKRVAPAGIWAAAFALGARQPRRALRHPAEPIPSALARVPPSASVA
jgi:mitochondrial fission protein ELM1